MKKIFATLLACVLCFAMCTTVYAASSVSKDVTGITSDGKKVTITVVPQSVIDDAGANMAGVLGADNNENCHILNVVDVSLPTGVVCDANHPVTITFSVPGVVAGMKVYAMHFNGSVWEKIVATAGKGTLKVTFNGLSPVAFVADTTTVSPTSTPVATTVATTSVANTSPQTGEAGVPVLFAVAAICGAGLVFVNKKKAI